MPRIWTPVGSLEGATKLRVEAVMERAQSMTAEKGAMDADRRRTSEAVAYHAAGGPGAIQQRLAELEGERSAEEMLEMSAALAGLAGLGLALIDRRWLALPAAVLGLLVQHAIQGWCPPMVALRRQGFRTAREIEEERTALKALRGDFRSLPRITEGRDPAAIESLLRAVRS